MPYDDTDVKKMIKYQTERKVGFSRHKKVSTAVKELIHGILEANIERRFSIGDIRQSAWMAHTADSLLTSTTTTTTPAADTSTTVSPADEVLSGSGQQPATETVIETGGLVDKPDHRPTDNSSDTASKLPRLATPTPTHGAGVTVLHRQTAGAHRASDCAKHAVLRSARRQDCDPIQSTAATPQLCLRTFVVRDRTRAGGR